MHVCLCELSKHGTIESLTVNDLRLERGEDFLDKVLNLISELGTKLLVVYVIDFTELFLVGDWTEETRAVTLAEEGREDLTDFVFLF